MNLFKTSFYSIITTATTMICGFISIKIVALQIGTEGVALTSQFFNYSALIFLFANSSINQGIIKYVSEYKNKPEQLNKLYSTVFKWTAITALITSLVVIVFSGQLTQLAFKSDKYSLSFIFLGLSLFFQVFNTVITSILNGLGEIRAFSIVSITGVLLNLTLTISLLFAYDLQGVLIAGSVSNFLLFTFSLYIFRKKSDFTFSNSKIDSKTLKNLFQYTLMSVFSGIVGPTVLILIRDKIINDYSVDEAGLWQSVTRISDYYLSFITTILGIYYLPKLSSISNEIELKKEIINGYKIILPVSACLTLLVWLFKKYVVLIIFNTQFLPSLPLYDFQLLGDFFKIASWLLAYLMIAKAQTKTFLFTELLFSITYILSAYIFINYFGIIGVTYGFCLSYFVYLLIMVLLFKRYLHS